MGKNDDFAARHARIKEQSNAADATAGTLTDPRSRQRDVQQGTGRGYMTGMLIDPRMVLGAFGAMALAAYVLGTTSDADAALAPNWADISAQYSQLHLPAGNAVASSAEDIDAPVASSEPFEVPEEMLQMLNKGVKLSELHQFVDMPAKEAEQ